MKKEPSPSKHYRRTPLRIRLKQWFANATGQALLAEEKDCLAEILPNLFGYHIVQVGELAGESLMTSSRINHHALLNIAPQETPEAEVAVCRASQLPIEGNTIDVVLLPHVLEFEEDPHEVLREAERILIGEGHIVILAFNPISLWGLGHLLLAWRREPPWSGQFFRSSRVQDWLGLLGFDILEKRTIYFRPPTRSERLIKRLAFLEELGHYAFPWFGAAYMIVAKKRLVTMTPTKTLWSVRRRLISTGISEARLGSMQDKNMTREDGNSG